MKLEKIKQLFENSHQQNKEEIILSNIIRCQEIIESNALLNKDVKSFKKEYVQLFENVSTITIPNTNLFINNENVLDIKDFRNNIYAYLSNVKSLLESSKEDTTLLFENESLISFQNTIENIIGNLDKINDFDKLDIANPIALSTRLFAKQPIYVFGVNLFDIEKLKSELGIKNLFGIIYNKSEKHLVFIGDGSMIYYNIKTDEFKDVRTLDYVENFKFNNKDFIEVFKNNVSRNIVIVYKNQSEVKFTDNLYHDSARYEEIQRVKQVNAKNKADRQFFKG